jgi:hypothetical protein
MVASDATAPVSTFERGHISSGDAPVPDLGRPGGPSPVAIDVVDDPHPMADPVGPQVVEGLGDRRQPERLAGMDGDPRAASPRHLERLQVIGGREPGLRTGDVESHHPGPRQRTAASAASSVRAALPHPVDDQPIPIPWSAPAGEAVPAPLRDVVDGPARRECSTRSEPDLGVDDPSAARSTSRLVRHPFEGISRLQDGDRVIERATGTPGVRRR